MTGKAILILIFYIVIATVNLLLGFLHKKNTAIIILTVFFLTLLMSLNTNGPDVNNYITEYNKIPTGKYNYEIGYTILSVFAYNIGLDFFAFRIIITSICFILILSTCQFFKINLHYAIGFYMCYLFFIDTIQFRNFIVEAILIYSFRYLCVNKKYNAFKYIITIGIATLFHRTAPMFLLLLLSKITQKKLVYDVINCITIILLVFFAVNRSMLKDLINWVLSILNISTGYSSTVTRFSYIPLVIMYYTENMIIRYWTNRYSKACTTNNLLILKNIYNCRVALSPALILLLINSNYYRFFRNMIFLTYIAYYIICFICVRKKYNVIFLLVETIVLTLGWFIIDYIGLNELAIIVNPIITSNLMIDSPIVLMKYIIPIIISVLMYAIMYYINKYYKYSKLELKGRIY